MKSILLIILYTISTTAISDPKNSFYGDSEKGEFLWIKQFACFSCHGKGNDKEPIPAPSQIVRGFTFRGDGQMESFSDLITETDMADIRAYLKNLDID